MRYIQHGAHPCPISGSGCEISAKQSQQKTSSSFLWMEVSILMWNKTGIQNDTPLKPEVTGSWSSGEVCAWEGGIREWLYLRLHQTSLRVQCQYKACLVVVPLNNEKGK